MPVMFDTNIANEDISVSDLELAASQYVGQDWSDISSQDMPAEMLMGLGRPRRGSFAPRQVSGMGRFGAIVSSPWTWLVVGGAVWYFFLRKKR
jgi:hypothetical protein